MVKTRIYTKEKKAQAHQDIDTYFSMADQPLCIQRHDPKRNESQQALLHSLIRELANHTGCDPEWFKQNVIKKNSEDVFPYWPHDLVPVMNGEKGFCPKSESKLTKSEESVVIEQLKVLGANWGCEFREGE